MGEMSNVSTIQQEIEQEEELNKIDDTSIETNPYREFIVNAEKIEPLMTQMELWPILSNILNYIQHDRHHTMDHTLDIKAINKCRNNQEQRKKENS